MGAHHWLEPAFYHAVIDRYVQLFSRFSLNRFHLDPIITPLGLNLWILHIAVGGSNELFYLSFVSLTSCGHRHCCSISFTLILYILPHNTWVWGPLHNNWSSRLLKTWSFIRANSIKLLEWLVQGVKITWSARSSTIQFVPKCCQFHSLANHSSGLGVQNRVLLRIDKFEWFLLHWFLIIVEFFFWIAFAWPVPQTGKFTIRLSWWTQ